MGRSLVPTIYRAILKTTSAAHRSYPDVKTVHIRPRLTGDLGVYTEQGLTGAARLQAAAEQWIPGLEVPPEQPVLSWKDLRALVRSNFEANSRVNPQQVAPLIDQAFAALRVLPELVYLEACSAVTTTDGVTVEATSCYSPVNLPAGVTFPGEDALQNLTCFRYRISITNERQHPIKVLGRSWTILNEGDLEQFVQLSADNGIVGQQPVIPPGGCFEYYSGAHLRKKSPAVLANGSMDGRLLIDFYGEDGGKEVVERLSVPVGPFRLMAPVA